MKLLEKDNLPPNLRKSEISELLGLNRNITSPVCNEVMAERRNKTIDAIKNIRTVFKGEYLEVFKRFDVAID